MSFRLSFQGQTYELTIRARRPDLVCAIDGRERCVSETRAQSRNPGSITIDGRHYRVWRSVDGESVYVHMAGRVFTVDLEDPLIRTSSSGNLANEIRADMPGAVIELHAEAGATVRAGDPVITIESMKMQIVLNMPRDGVIDQLHHELNDTFDKGAILVSLVKIVDA